MRIKRIISAFALACVLSASLCGAASAPEVSARCAVLTEAATGRVLFSKNMDNRMKIASVTKVMTALVVLDIAALDETVTVGREAVCQEGSSIYLSVGEEVTVEALLYGLLLESGNDAAMALAEHCGGLEAFVEKMNEKAEELGLRDTSFENPSGLDGKNHYSTARDVARMMAAAMMDRDFRRITGTTDINIGGHSFYNHNKLLRRYEYADGGKTGYTKAAGRTLVTTAIYMGRRLIAVTLDAPGDWDDHERLYEFGFNMR